MDAAIWLHAAIDEGQNFLTRSEAGPIWQANLRLRVRSQFFGIYAFVLDVEALAEFGLLPMYGMPTRVRNLHMSFKSNGNQPKTATIDRDLDMAIELLNESLTVDALQLQRLKKRKLQLKDQIIQLKMQLVPNIPA